MIDLIDLLCPACAGFPDDLKLKALEYAKSKRPLCLSEDEQKEAQVYYAAWLLSKQNEVIIPSGIKSESEGDLSRTYGDTGSDNSGYLGQYTKLANKCKQFIPLARG